MIDIFLDRDGVLIYDKNYLNSVEEVIPIDKTLSFLASLESSEVRFHVVSNQSGVGRGLISLSQHQAINSRFLELMSSYGIVLSSVEYCLHSPIDECDCRKPRTSLFERIATLWDVDRQRCLVIGDKSSDYQAGVNFGCQAVIVSANVFVPSEWLAVSSIINALKSSE